MSDLPLPGESRVIADKYTILETIARGGMGVVYKARQDNLNRVVAVKMLLGGVHASEGYKRRFVQEAKAVARLAHPNIVAIHDWGEDAGQAFFSMDYIEGKTLAEMARDKPMPPREAAEVVRTLAQAMHYANGQGILHRDLKPSNVLVDTAGVPRITDFGLARETNQETMMLTGTGDMLGTPGFLPPEQVFSKAGKIGPPSDVYGLGAILYYLLTSRAPHVVSSPTEALRAVQEIDPVSPRRLNPDVPVDLETVCLKCLQKSPHRRYQAAASLEEDLRRWLGGEPILARPVSTWERGRKWAERNRLKAGFSLMLGMVTVLASVIVLAQWRRAEVSATATRELLLRSYIETGMKCLAEDAPIEALPWLAAGARLQRDDPAASEMNHDRLGAALHSSPSLVQMFFHSESINAVAFSPDGRRLATAHRDKTARVWDIATGQPVTPLLKGDGEVANPLESDFSDFVEFSPDGSRLLASTDRRSAWIWDLATARPAAPALRHAGTVTTAAFSPSGDCVVTASSDRTARVWNVKDGRPLTPYLTNSGEIYVARFSPDGTKLVTGNSGHQAELWDAETGALLRKISHRGDVFHAVFSPDSRSLLTASRDTGARLWDVATGAETKRRVHRRDVNFVSFNPQGTRFISASEDHRALVTDIASKEVGPFLTHKSSVLQGTFSPDGRWVLTASADRTARVWDATTGNPAGPPLPHGGVVRCARFSPDGTLVATASADRTARLWRFRTNGAAGRVELPAQVDQITCLAFCADGRRFASGNRDRTAYVWDSESGQRMGGKLRAPAGNHVFSVCFDPPGQRLLTANEGLSARVWDLNSGLCILTNHHNAPVSFASYSPDGRLFASVSFDRTARLWNSGTGEPIGQAMRHSNEIVQAAFSPDGRRLATASWDRTAGLWDTSNGQPMARLTGHGAEVNCVAFSPDGLLLGTASRDGTTRLWDAVHGRALPWLLRHEAAVNSVHFSPDGRRVVTASDDRTARVWDATTGQALCPALQHPNRVVYAVFSPEGRRVLTAHWDGSARLWDAVTGLPIGPPMDEAVSAAALSPSGKKVVTGTLNGTLTLWTIPHEDRPLDCLLDYTELLSNHRVTSDAKGLTLLTPSEIQSLWSKLRTNFPEEFRVQSAF